MQNMRIQLRLSVAKRMIPVTAAWRIQVWADAALNVTIGFVVLPCCRDRSAPNEMSVPYKWEPGYGLKRVLGTIVDGAALRRRRLI